MAIRQRVPETIKRPYRFFRRGKNRLEAAYWGRVLERDLKKHALHETKRTKQVLLRPFNIDDPIYFSEKLSWLKYNVYNESPLIAQCYNKYEVREYIESKGLGSILNELYGVWDSIDEIPWDSLPEEYAMKLTNGYAGHVFKRKGKPFSVKKAIKTLKATEAKYKYYYKITGDMFVAKTKQRIICERILHSNLGFEFPEDYKFYCFNGEPLYIEYMVGRSGVEAFSYHEVLVDINLNDRHELEKGVEPGTFDKPSCYDEMIRIARILSADFPFVRVDLYVENEKPIFGELTFTPTHYHTKQSEIEYGQLLDISNVKVLQK